MNLKEVCASLVWNSVPLTKQEISFVRSQEKLGEESGWKKFLNFKANFNLDEAWHNKHCTEHKWLIEKGVQLLAPWEQDYPLNFKSLKYPPFVSVMGNIKSLNAPSMSVVGSRNPTSLTMRWLRTEFNDFLLSQKRTIVSGGARGVDIEVHKQCVVTNTPTVCFLPSGLAKMYPSDLLNWVPEILATGGAIVTQFSPFTQIYKSHFHKRNELIAALSHSTFVVEARQRSGSLLTASKALSLGREIATLPCSPNIATGKGNLSLLREGAQMIVDAQDLETFWERNLINFLPDTF